MEKLEIKKIKYNEMSLDRLKEILNNIKDKNIGIIGDGSLDLYWNIDMTRSLLSRETPHFPYPVTGEKVYLGGGANVAANLVELGVGEVSLLTLIGKDWRGSLFKQTIKEKGINSDFIIESAQRRTPAYCKPLLHGYCETVQETNRIDFENNTDLKKVEEEDLLEKISNFFVDKDAILIADQLDMGIITEKVRKKILSTAEIFNSNSNCPGDEKLVIADSRDSIHKFGGIILKPNHIEAYSAVYPGKIPGEDLDEWIRAGDQLVKKTGSPVLMTMGSKGAVWLNSSSDILQVPAVEVEEPFDVVGAGDTYLAAFASARVAGADLTEAMIIAAISSAITLKKIQMTGTASPGEIIEKYSRLVG